jgi:SAM-dependent methyltransferase
MMKTSAHMMQRRTALAATLLLPYMARAQAANAPKLDVHYVPTPMPVVNKMLEMAGVKRGDMLYDLGCGDGRIVVTAAKELGARGFGIDLDPVRIEEAKANARSAGVTDSTRFEVGDLFKTDLSGADVVTLYLLPELNLRLRPQLWRQLKVGTRIVSHAFRMGDWPPEQTEIVQNASIYRWTITESVKTSLMREPARG